MATQAPPLMTLEEYFELERKSVDRHEYLNGHVIAMAGGTKAHSIISLNIGADLNLQLREKPCTAYNGEMRISTHWKRHYTYADAAVACGEVVQNDTLLNPVLIVEVLSKSTESYDRGKSSCVTAGFRRFGSTCS
jgi:Uma2 family endonuclease